jgi:site-specific DNA recombinase
MGKSKMRKVSSAGERVIRAALYVRVSTDRQAEEGYSIEVQSERLLAYTKTFDAQVQTELYVDDGFSGASLERPAMQRLIADVKSGAVTHVCVTARRLSRSQKDTLYLIEDVSCPTTSRLYPFRRALTPRLPSGAP